MKNIFLALFLFLLLVPKAFSHCEIPCGIYDDEARISEIKEHIMTIEKSMKMIKELSEEEDKDYNQLVRWIDNKEVHSGYIQHIVSQYFLTQRIKPQGKKGSKVYEKYLKELTLLHEILVSAMRCKQTTGLSEIDDLKRILEEFRISYFRIEKKDRE